MKVTELKDGDLFAMFNDDTHYIKGTSPRYKTANCTRLSDGLQMSIKQTTKVRPIVRCTHCSKTYEWGDVCEPCYLRKQREIEEENKDLT